MRTPNEIIDELIRARAVNNEHWGALIRLAWEAAPDRAREISQRINAQDRVVVGLAEELAQEERPYSVPAFKGISERKAVIIPGGGVLHTYAVREALALGLTPIVTDRDPDCPCAKIEGVEFHEIDCYDVDAHLALVYGDPPKLIVGAFCGGADTHVVVAAIHEVLQTGRWVSRKTAETCKDKLRAKEVLLAAEVPTARFAYGVPSMCKPRVGSGSREVRRVLDTAEPCRNADGIHEELLEGPEQSVEILLRRDGYVGINIVDRHFAWVDEQPLEWGHTNPTRLVGYQLDQLYELAFQAAQAVGASVGFFKIDSIWTKDGPKVLECTPRLSGGYDSQLSTPLSSGRNLLRYGLQLACGLPLDERLLERSKDERVTIIHRPHLASAEAK